VQNVPGTVPPEGSVVRPGEAEATVNIVDWCYFRTLGIPIKAGRSFSLEDRANGAPVVIVSDRSPASISAVRLWDAGCRFRLSISL
jgi:hypothetical protein